MQYYIFAQAPNILWAKTNGGKFSDLCRAHQLTMDDGFILVGETESFVGLWLLKLNNILQSDR